MIVYTILYYTNSIVDIPDYTILMWIDLYYIYDIDYSFSICDSLNIPDYAILMWIDLFYRYVIDYSISICDSLYYIFVIDYNIVNQ